MSDQHAIGLKIFIVFIFGITVSLGLPAIQNRSAAGEAQLAIKGYDPVAYFTMSRPVKGKPEISSVIDGVRYRFVSAKHLKMFREDPDRYVPQFRGLCAMGLAAKGYKVVADPENWVIYNDRLYLTQRSFGPPIFKKAPEKWSMAARDHLKSLEDLPVGSSLSWW